MRSYFRPGLLFVLVCFVGLGLQGCGEPRASVLKTGDEFPGFRLSSLDGPAWTDERAKEASKPVVVNFWATWCGPCVREIPALQSLHHSGEVTVIAVSLDKGGRADVQPFVEEQGIDYPVVTGGMDLFRRLGGEVVPFTLVLDAELRLVKAHRGLVTLHTLEREVPAALEAAQGS